MKLLLEVTWFLLPAGLANVAPVVAARLLPKWDAPIDGGKSFRGVRILGDHKTIRGFVAGTLVGTVVYLVQAWSWERSAWVRSISLVDASTAPLWLGALLGFGALLGDACKSFCKRRRGRAPGEPWFPFDQLDWALGALALSYAIARPGLVVVLVALLLALLFSLVGKWLGYVLHLDDRPI